MKQWVYVKDYSVSIDDLFDGRSLDDTQLELAKLCKKHGDKHHPQGHRLSFYTYHYGYDGGLDLYIRVEREETDKEYAARLKRQEEAARVKAEKAAARRAKKLAKAQAVIAELEDQERAEYERLKAKFG